MATGKLAGGEEEECCAGANMTPKSPGERFFRCLAPFWSLVLGAELDPQANLSHSES